jgi:hypothetical protein
LADLQQKGKIRVKEGSNLDELPEMETETLLRVFFKVTFEVSLPFVFSFCAHDPGSSEFLHGLLSQWRAYGRDGGFALEFDTRRVEDLMELDGESATHSGYYLSSVLYSDDDPDMRYVRGTISSIEEVVDMTVEAAVGLRDWDHDSVKASYLPYITLSSRIKDRSFREEKEVRLLHFVPTSVPKDRKPAKKVYLRERGSGLVPYVKLLDVSKDQALPIKRIIVGPHLNLDLRVEALRMFVRQSKLDIEVTASEIPYLPDV